MIEKEIESFSGPVTVVIFGSHYTGKTTLAHLFSHSLDFQSIEERWQNNPYLLVQEKQPLDNQIWYLHQTIDAMHKAKELNSNGKSVVLDTFPYSTLLFSQIFLSENDYSKFLTVFHSLMKNVPNPDLLIYLQTDVNFLFDKRRVMRLNSGKSPKTDSTVSREWLNKSCQAHDQFFSTWHASPKILINIEKKDFLNNTKDFKKLIFDMTENLEQKRVVHPN